MNGSTILTIGTALSRAEQAGAQVHALVQGAWISGRVLGIDGHGVVLRNDEGESAVLRLEHVAAIRIDEAAVAEPEAPTASATQEQQIFPMGAGVDHSKAEPSPVSTGLTIAHPAELSA